MKILALLLTLSSTFAAADCPPANGGNWQAEAIASLCGLAPDEYKVYEWAKIEEHGGKKYFLGFMTDKADPLNAISTAVHESVHNMTQDKRAYPMINGKFVDRAKCVERSEGMLKPKVLYKQFDKADGMVQTYLHDTDSADDFCMMLDEMNAHSHDTNVSVHLKDQVKSKILDRRAGLLATMAFVKAYADQAQRFDPKTWEALRGPLKETITALWKQAGAVAKNSCGNKNWGGRYGYDSLCDKKQMGAITAITQETPAICDSPATCRPEAGDRDETAGEESKQFPGEIFEGETTGTTE